MKKIAIVLTFLLLALCIVGSVAFADEGENAIAYGSGRVDAIQDGGFPEGNVKYEEGIITEKLPSYNATSLSGAEKVIYDAIIECQGSVNVEDYNLTSATLAELMEKIINDHPELFHVNSSYSYSYYPSTGLVTNVRFTYNMNKYEYVNAYNVYSAEVDKIAAYVSGLDTATEKIIAVNDYICSNYEYDQSYTIRDAYNFVVYKKGVCQSYTLMFTAVMQKLGIEVSWATSEAMNHIWNVVKCDGKWYHIDLTWNDPVGGKNYMSYHNNILRSDNGISATGHYGWTTSVVCTSNTYEDAFWIGKELVFVPVGDLLYYIDQNAQTLNSFDYESSAYTVVKTFDYKWYTEGGNSYYSGMYSGLSVYNGVLYFNSPTSILLYNTENGDLIEFLTPVLNDGYICASRVSDGIIRFAVSYEPYRYSDNEYQGTLETYLPKYNVTWNVDGSAYTSTFAYGMMPEYENGIPSKAYDSEYHYSFLSWSPSLSAVYSNQSYTAIFRQVEHTYKNGVCSCGKTGSDFKVGFVTEIYGTRYYYADGSFATGFATIDGKTYRFDPVTGVLYTESVLYGANTYYFNPDHSTIEGIVYEDGGMRFYKKGVRQYGWVDINGDGKNDTYFFVSSQLRCEEDRVLFDGVDARRFFSYNEATGYMEVVNGFYTNEKGTQFFKNGIGQYGWITADGVSITDKPGITLSDVHYFAYGDGLNFYMIESATKTIGGVVREFDENHLAKAYTGWATNKTTGNANYYIEGVLQQGWCETPDGWVYLSRSENLANNITYGDVFYAWRKIGGKVYYFRASTSTPQYTVITDATRQLTYNGVRGTYYINQTAVTGTGADYYITNPPAGL